MVMPITAESLLRIYLDASVMIDYCWVTEPRHREAVRLINVVERNFDLVLLHASKWTWMESHGSLYDKILQSKGITKGCSITNHKYKDKKPRTYFPPLQKKLGTATRLITKKYQEIDSVTHFDLDDPDENDIRILNIAEDLARYGGIYPQDSYHVATSIRLRCNFFVTNDADLLDRLCTAPCKQIVDQYMIESSAPLPSYGFEAFPTVILTNRRRQKTYTIFKRLSSLGKI